MKYVDENRAKLLYCSSIQSITLGVAKESSLNSSPTLAIPSTLPHMLLHWPYFWELALPCSLGRENVTLFFYGLSNRWDHDSLFLLSVSAYK